MARSLKNATLTRRSSVSQTVQSSRKFHEEISSETNVKDLSDEMQKKIVYMKDSDLIDDPYNAEVYGDLDVELLSEAMNTYGFQGVILAYPIGDGKYRIESGHRRRAAARAASISEYPVFVTEAPKTEYERRIRLFLGNLHSRNENPMTKARVAEGLYQAHRQEMKDRKAAGLVKEGETTFINDIVAADMEINTGHVSRLRALLKLNVPLQGLAASGDYSWTDLSAASTLSEQKQQQLYEKIISRRDKYGVESVNRKFLQTTINELKQDSLSERKKENVTRRNKRNYVRMVIKAGASLTEALSDQAEYSEADRAVLVQTLEEMQTLIDRKLRDLRTGDE